MRKQKGSIQKSLPSSSKKESVFKELIKILDSAGYEVRREKLKQGHGWKVVSGACRCQEQRLIFVDQRLPQDEQISFLINKVKSLKIELSAEIEHTLSVSAAVE